MKQNVHNIVEISTKRSHEKSLIRKLKLTDLCIDVVSIMCTFLDRKDLNSISKVITDLCSNELRDVWVEAMMRDSLTRFDQLMFPEIKTTICSLLFTDSITERSTNPMNIYLQSQKIIDECKTRVIFCAQHQNVSPMTVRSIPYVSVYSDPRMETIQHLIEGTFDSYYYEPDLHNNHLINDMSKVVRYVIRILIDINTDGSVKMMALIHRHFKSHPNITVSKTVIKAMSEELTNHPNHLRKMISQVVEINSTLERTRRESHEAITQDTRTSDTIVLRAKRNTINSNTRICDSKNHKSDKIKINKAEKRAQKIAQKKSKLHYR